MRRHSVSMRSAAKNSGWAPSRSRYPCLKHRPATPIHQPDAGLRIICTAPGGGRLITGSIDLTGRPSGRSDHLCIVAFVDDRNYRFTVSLVAALTALGVEHAAVAPPDVASRLAKLSLTVVTQPNFVRERGDAYLADVEPRDRPWLYRGRGLLEASVPLGGGTDAPFGDPDPWAAMRAAVDRRTEAAIA